MKRLPMAILTASVILAGGLCAAGEYIEEVPQPVQEESQWERFKAGAREAGGAVAEGARRTAHKIGDGAEKAGDAIVRGSRKTGRTIADGYEDVKEYVHEKTE